jgi:hypothetical protein
VAANTTNVTITPGSGVSIETENVPQPGSLSGDRQRVQISGRAGSSTTEAANDVATVLSADPASTEYGLTTRIAGRVKPSYCNTAPVITGVSVGLTAVAVPASAAANRRRIRVRNLDILNSIYIGNAGVTIATGFRVAAGETFDAAYGPGIALYAVAENYAAAVAVLEDVE